MTKNRTLLLMIVAIASLAMVAVADPDPHAYAFPDPIAAADPAVLPISREALYALGIDINGESGNGNAAAHIAAAADDPAPNDSAEATGLPVDSEVSPTTTNTSTTVDPTPTALPTFADDARACSADEIGDPYAGSFDLVAALWSRPRLPAAAAAAAAGGTGGATLAAGIKAKVERAIAAFEAVQNPGLLQPDTCVNLGDGRGYTAGIGAFTTMDGDALAVMTRLRSTYKRSDLAAYESPLASLAAAQSGDVTGIPKFCCAWKQVAASASAGPLLAAAQRDISDLAAYVPAMAIADAIGATAAGNALVRAHLYDAVGVHGLDDSPDSVYSILARARTTLGLDPKTAVWPATVTPAAFHSAFASARQFSLQFPYDQNPNRDGVQAAAFGPSDPTGNPVIANTGATRVDCFVAWATAGNWDLNGPLSCVTAEYNFVVSA
ncbi:hypothetical protein BC828DRAFT_384369 [Blastocladiella britannica]|nr:hypothetical protein BC828DRAFT_384369 [Blastocladiella britannica]